MGFALVSLLFGFESSYGHTTDVVEDYKIEISWLKQPRANLTNEIEIFVSIATEDDKMLAKSMNQTGSTNMKMMNKIDYVGGISNLDELRAQLVRKTDKIDLELVEDPKIPGRYFSEVNPWTHGNFQVNVLGKIKETNVSIALHPAKVKPLQPLKQLRNGINPQDVICDDGLFLIQKIIRPTVACVKQTTADKLVTRGWAVI